MGKFLSATFVLLTMGFIIACAQVRGSEAPGLSGYRVVTVADNLHHPWALAFLPDGGFLVTERRGTMLFISEDGSRRQRISGIPEVAAINQGGLLDLLLAPNFAESRILYLSWSGRGDGGTGIEVGRGRLSGSDSTGFRLTRFSTIFRAVPKRSSNANLGSRLMFDAEGKLLVSIGDRFDMEEAQNPSNHLGTVVRINTDGSVPKNNPFVNREGYQPEIYTLGHRNIQGMMLDRETDQVWVNEHGPRGGDEINILEAGANYGWPLVTYGKNYDGSVISNRTEAAGLRSPVLHWTPSIAPSGMTRYTGDRFPEWQGNIFVGALVGRHLRRIIFDRMRVVRQEMLLEELGARIRDVRTGPDGFLYLLTDSPNGALLRLEPEVRQ